MAGAELLHSDFGIDSDIWSVTSFNELARDGQHVARWNLLHPESAPRESHVARRLKDREGPVVASTDYMKLFADQIRGFVPADYTVLGTDGFGRSDTREKLRHHFEVDRYYVAVAALGALARQGRIEASVVSEALRRYHIDADRPNPLSL